MRIALALMWAVSAGAQCRCEAAYGACREAATSNVIFIGTVESVAPTFLDSWNEAQKASLELLNREYARAGQEKTPAAFARLRDAYLRVFTDLPAESKRKLEKASSSEELAKLFYWVLDHGKRVRFTVGTPYRNGDDDEDDEAPETLDIWTAFGECGVNFQVGETYLVYADSDEESEVVTTTACHRTRRLSEAGDDLAFLYFQKTQPKRAARLEVFVTSDLEALKRRDRDRYAQRIDAPAADVTVEIDDGVRRLRAVADEGGRAVFDGLAAGEYQVTAYASGYPAEKKVVAAPRKVTVDARGCGSEVVVAGPRR